MKLNLGKNLGPRLDTRRSATVGGARAFAREAGIIITRRVSPDHAERRIVPVSVHAMRSLLREAFR